MRFIALALVVFSLAGCGKDGAAGAAGPAGATGPRGADGTNNKIVGTLNCSGQVTGLAGAPGAALNGLWIGYNAALTAAGDVFASAYVSTPGLQIGDSIFYSAQQNGAQTASVIFTADFATSNSGFWNVSVNRSTLIATAVYTDSSLAPDSPVTIVFAPSACQQHTY